MTNMYTWRRISCENLWAHYNFYQTLNVSRNRLVEICAKLYFTSWQIFRENFFWQIMKVEFCRKIFNILFAKVLIDWINRVLEGNIFIGAFFVFWSNTTSVVCGSTVQSGDDQLHWSIHHGQTSRRLWIWTY